MDFEPEFASLLNQAISTPRLSLEPLMCTHAEILYQSLCDQRIYEWIDAGGPKDFEQLRSRWQRNECRLSPDGTEIWLNWAIRLKNNGPYIGKLDAELDTLTNVSNIGFVFFPQFWGNGYATEALLAVKDVMSLNGVTSMRATVASPNIASARVLEKAGFVRGNLIPDERDTYEFRLQTG